MLSVKAREAADIIFKVFGMNTIHHASQANALTTWPRSWRIIIMVVFRLRRR